MQNRKYFKYHNNLIGTTHGDGAKENDLPLLMAHEAKEDWAVVNHRYFYTHHIHHKSRLSIAHRIRRHNQKAQQINTQDTQDK